MRRIVRACAFALATMPIACTGCKAPGPPQSDAASGSLTPQQSAQVLARVGSHEITLADYATALEHMDQFDRMRYQSPERRRELLGEMIDVLLLADEARDKGYDKDPLTQQEMREVLRDALLAKAREGAPTPSQIADEDVRAYYEAHRTEFRDPERRRVSAITLASQAAADATLEAARKAGPVQWGEIVRSKSIDPQAKADVPADLAGDLGFVAPPGDSRGANPRVPDEVRSAVYEIAKVGDVLPRAVASGTRFYVVKLAGTTDAHDRSLQEAERTIRVKLAQERVHAKEEALLEELRKQYPVKIDEAALGQVHVDLPAGDSGTL